MPAKKKTITMPVLALRGLMVFPHMVLHFDVGRAKSVAALEQAMPALHPEIREKTRHNPMDRPVTLGAITVTEGRNRQIRRMMKTARCLVLRLKRVRVGDIVLDGDLQPGEWKEIFPFD